MKTYAKNCMNVHGKIKSPKKPFKKEQLVTLFLFERTAMIRVHAI